MIFRLAALIGLLLMVYWALNSLARRLSLNARQSYLLLGLGVFLAVIIVMIVIGRLPVQFILAPVGVAITYLLRMLPHLLRLMPLWAMLRGKMNYHRATSGASQHQVSKIQTAFLSMELHHSSGDMDGTVLQGNHAGKKLSTLSLSQLRELAGEVAADRDSLQVLEAYLDRMHSSWREEGEQTASSSGVDDSIMTRSLALEILGLQDPVSAEQINQAHRKLMQKLHPDRGGSDYLAKKINSARDYLEQHR